MTTLSFDEVNKLVENERAIPYQKYFGEMNISEKQKEKRIHLAFLFEELFLYPMILLLNIRNYGGDWAKAEKAFYDAYYEAAEKVGYKIDEEYLREHISVISREIVDASKRHMDDPYFFSNDRIKVISENESNSFFNAEDYFSAKKNGRSKKTWIAIMDDRTRDDHVDVNGTTVGIDDMFLVGGTLMLFPRWGNDIKQIANCRCTAIYS